MRGVTYLSPVTFVANAVSFGGQRPTASPLLQGRDSGANKTRGGPSRCGRPLAPTGERAAEGHTRPRPLAAALLTARPLPPPALRPFVSDFLTSVKVDILGSPSKLSSTYSRSCLPCSAHCTALRALRPRSRDPDSHFRPGQAEPNHHESRFSSITFGSAAVTSEVEDVCTDEAKSPWVNARQGAVCACIRAALSGAVTAAEAALFVRLLPTDRVWQSAICKRGSDGPLRLELRKRRLRPQCAE